MSDGQHSVHKQLPTDSPPYGTVAFAHTRGCCSQTLLSPGWQHRPSVFAKHSPAQNSHSAAPVVLLRTAAQLRWSRYRGQGVCSCRFTQRGADGSSLTQISVAAWQQIVEMSPQQL